MRTPLGVGSLVLLHDQARPKLSEPYNQVLLVRLGPHDLYVTSLETACLQNASPEPVPHG